jgi:hypothetical protein
MFSSPAIAGGMLYFGLVAVNLAGFKPAWTFETEGVKEYRPACTKADGTPNGEALFRCDFYDDMVAGVDRTMSMGSIFFVAGGGGRCGLCGERGWESARLAVGTRPIPRSGR